MGNQLPNTLDLEFYKQKLAKKGECHKLKISYYECQTTQNK